MLTSKDIMIGDYVIVKRKNVDEARQVDVNLIKDLTMQEYGFVRKDQHEFITVDSIPLSGHTLINSGFKEDPLRGEATYTYSSDYYDIEIKEISDGVWKLIVDHTEIGSGTDTCVVCSVDQLQKALRVFSITTLKITL